MSDENEKPTEARGPQSMRRLSTGTLVVLQLALAVLLVLSINYLSGTHPKIWDYTKGREFTLSKHTTRLLASGALAKREAPVKLFAAVRKSSAHFPRLRTMAEEYARLSNGKIQLEFVDPIRDADKALELSDAYGAIFVEDVFIIDARPVLPDLQEGEERDAAALEELREAHIRYVTVEDMLVFRIDPRGERRLVGYQDEDLLTSSILSALEGQPRKFYFLADKSQLQDASPGTPWGTLADLMRRQNIALVPLRISDVSEAIPEDAEGVAIVAPQDDLNDREMGILRDYWMRKRSALFVILDPQLRRQPANLRSFLRENGVTPRTDRVLTLENGKRLADVRATFTFGAELNRLNDDLSGRATVFEGSTGSLEVREGGEDLELRRISPVALIEAAQGYWGESDYDQDNPSFSTLEDNPPPLYLAASILRGNERDDRVVGQSSRMVIVYNLAFLHPDNRHTEQIDFLRNATNWMIGREELIGIGPRPVQNYKLNLVPSQVSFANKLNLFLIPAAFLLVSLFVWNARRA